ncbi:MAG: hypothetical protein IJ523_09320 [Succinivibrionaceae bacterium]|nr:hypothetical protein [Succinivibrionaceae bacterium]
MSDSTLLNPDLVTHTVSQKSFCEGCQKQESSETEECVETGRDQRRIQIKPLKPPTNTYTSRFRSKIKIKRAKSADSYVTSQKQAFNGINLTLTVASGDIIMQG